MPFVLALFPLIHHNGLKSIITASCILYIHIPHTILILFFVLGTSKIKLAVLSFIYL